MASSKKSSGAGRPAPMTETRAAYEKLAAQIAGVGDDAPVVRTNIPVAVSIALAAVDAVQPMVGALREELPKTPETLLADIKEQALATLHAHLMGRQAEPADPTRREELLEEARLLRRQLLAAAESLVAFGVFDESHVAEIRSGQGHVDRASDLVALAGLFTANWKAVDGRSPVTEAHVVRAGELGPELLALLGDEDAAAQDPAVWDLRQRQAFALLRASYEQARRAVAYFRWDAGDAAKITPTLFPRSGRPRSTAANTSDLAGDASSPAA